jgi:TrpR-related protein YerC/YecD
MDFTSVECYNVSNVNVVFYTGRQTDMNKKIMTPEVETLFKAILCLEDVGECYSFFEDICTINELLSLSQRFEVARMLRAKKTYLEIAQKTGASTATISRVNRALVYGNDGYSMVLERIGISDPV